MDKTAIMRAAIRREGEFVNAYLAHPNTMEGAVLVASVRVSALEQDAVLFDEFKAMMGGLVTRLVARETGEHVFAGEAVPAPEHERSGHA